MLSKNLLEHQEERSFKSAKMIHFQLFLLAVAVVALSLIVLLLLVIEVKINMVSDIERQVQIKQI